MIAIPGTVLCAGNLTEDILVWPVEEVKFGTTSWVEDITTSTGGNGANTAYAMARLGGRVRLAGSVGQDAAGEWILELLGRVGVDLRVERCELPTPITVAIVRRDGARAFLHRPGASRRAFAGGLPFTPDTIAGCTHFHLANPFSMPEMRVCAAGTLERARAAGLTTSLDTGWDSLGEWLGVIGPCLAHVDVLFANQEEAAELSGEADPGRAADFFLGRGVGACVIKLGPAGCAVFEGSERLDVPGFTVEAVDTTGAGDCFVGAFLAALQAGKPAAEAARVANAAGALNVQRAGATTGLLDLAGTLEWMRSRQGLRST